ncbi:MAG: ATP-binding protein [Salinibacter sp.]|uniref:sensor histidine kinase n=1 Tax=Salinibacter sp. TaxID=2065818 RepID=UPI0035D4AD42
MIRSALRRLWRSLYGRISLLYLGLSLALCLACAWLTVCHFRTFMGAVNQRLDRELAANLVPRIEAAAAADSTTYDQAVGRVARRISDLRPAVQLYVLDASGHIQSTSIEPPYVKRDNIRMEPIQAFVEGATAPVRAQDPASTTDRKVFSAAPIEGPDGQTDYLYVILNGCSADAIAATFKQTYVWRTFGSSLLLALGFTTVVGLVLFWFLTRRFRALTGAVQRFKDGEHDERVDDPADDEIGQLGQAFNEMADTIAAQVAALRRTDEKRRRLVAQVSHDFRTPLTSIRGHAERLLGRTGSGDGAPDRLPDGPAAGDGASATPRDDRVKMILQNAEQLDRLAGRLHELSRFDGQGFDVDMEPFSIAELAHDLVLKFRPKAERRGVSLDLKGAPDVPPVRGDIGMIERLLSNVVENALEHTPEGGDVTVQLRTVEKEVEVRVADTGVGIPSDELPLVTQRFYRVEEQSGRAGEGDSAEDRDGSGLGLAIASEIAEAHGTVLDIESTLGVGTRVRFRLAQARTRDRTSGAGDDS